MLRLKQLNFYNYRNFINQRFEFAPEYNLIVGNNATGKTSILEGIYLFSHAKSFRSNDFEDLVNFSADVCSVNLKLHDTKSKNYTSFGFARENKKNIWKLDSEIIKDRSNLLQLLPSILIAPDCANLISSPPKFRRSYLDWGCFYLKSSFIQVWRDFNKILRHRNLLLKAEKKYQDIVYWDLELVKKEVQINQTRKRIATQLVKHVTDCFCLITAKNDFEISLSYTTNWTNLEKEDDIFNPNIILEQYKHNYQKDLFCGITQKGAHRADLAIRVNGRDAYLFLSRAMQKLLHLVLILSLQKLFNLQTGKKALILFDDLAAELDYENRHRLIEYLYSLDNQLIITTSDDSLFKDYGFQQKINLNS